MKHVLATLSFFSKYQGLHGFNRRSRSTVRAIKSLEKQGYLRVFWDTDQAAHTGKVFA